MPWAAESSAGDECRPTVGEGNRGMALGLRLTHQERGKPQKIMRCPKATPREQRESSVTGRERSQMSRGLAAPLTRCRG